MALSKIKTNSLADDAVTQAKIADNAVTAQMISDGTIAAADLASSAVTNAKLSANAVTNIKVDASAAIAASKLDLSTITGPISITRASGIATTINRSGSAGTSLKVETGNIDITAGTLTMNGSTVIANNRAITATAITATGAFTSQGIDDNADATAITIDSSGNVGIGTSSPASPSGFGNGGILHLKGSANNDCSIVLEGLYSSGGRQEIGVSTGDLYFNRGAATGSMSTSMVIKSTGNVGIGTTSPSTLIHLEKGSTGSGGGSDAGITMTNKFDSPDNSWSITPQRSGVSNTGLQIRDETDSRTDMVFDGSGQVGIGTSSPSYKLDVVGSSANIRVAESGGGDLRMNVSGSTGGIGTHSNHPLIFRTNSTERMRIDASGNFMVGKTAISVADVGVEARPDGIFASTRSGGEAIRANRKDSDGDIIQLRRDNLTVGSIGARGGDIYMATADTGIRAYDAQDAILPVGTDGASRDNAIDLGIGSIRFKNLNLSGGVYLGGTGSANLLDDYEEGTWTPSLGGSSSDPTVSYTANRSGSYIKVGDVVHVMGRVNTTSVSGGSGVALIRGLPFATGAERNAGAVGYISQLSNSSGYTTTGLNPDASASSMRIVQSGSGLGGATVAIGNIGNGFDLTFSHTYKV